MTTDRKATIVIAINDFLVGGAQKLILDQLSCFDRSRFNFELLTFFEFPARRDFYADLPEWLPVTRLGFRSVRDLGGWLRLWRYWRRVRPDVVVSHLFFSNTLTRLSRLWFRFRVITVEHNTYTTKRPFHIWIDRVLASQTETIIAVSRVVADFTAAQERIPAQKFTVIHNGVPLHAIRAAAAETTPSAARAELGYGADEFLCINVARLTSQKNHPLLLRGFRRFLDRSPKARLVILGEGDQRSNLEVLARELHLGDRVVFAGVRRDIVRFYVAADVQVSTSDIEGLSLAFLEALALGLPLVATKTAGTDELLEDGQSGFFIAERTPEAVATTLARAEAAGRERLAAAARQSAERFDISRNAQAYEQLFTAARR